MLLARCRTSFAFRHRLSISHTQRPLSTSPPHHHRGHHPPSPASLTELHSLSLTTLLLPHHLSSRHISIEASNRIATPQSSGAEPIYVYKNVRQLQAAAISGIAVLQGGFWVSSAIWTAAYVADPVVSQAWMVGGAGLSGMFAMMVNAYLSRSVAALSIHGSESLLMVETYRFGGMVRKAVEVPTKMIEGGPKGADEDERHWTFGVKASKDGGAFYYIVDRKKGVLDRQVLEAVCGSKFGGEKVMVLLHKRRALQMKERWKDWEETQGATGRRE